MVFCVLIIFLLSTSGEKGQGQSEKLPWLLQKFFESAIGHSLFKACSQQLESRWQQYFEKRFWRFYGYG